jgi:hypothetical protein
MANPDEQSKYTDPELEALLADAPPDTQQTVREIIKSLQSNLSAEEWTAIRRTFVNDLLAMQEKRRLEQELAEMEKGMKEVEESVEKLRRLIDESGESNKG